MIKLSKRKLLINSTQSLLTQFKHYSSTIQELQFNQYLAGVIDGGGSLLISKAGYGSLEITMDSRDERCLQYLKNKIGTGGLKARSGSKSVRYRVTNREGMLNVVNRINGLIKYPQGVVQLKNLCILYKIEYIENVDPTIDSAYFAGIVDSGGTLTCSMKKPKHSKVARPQLTISVSSKNKDDLDVLVKVFGGNIYADDKGKHTYKWSIQKKEKILAFIEYLQKYPLHTLKQNRVLMINEYYRLYELHAFKPENTVLNKQFKKWLEKWSSYGYSRKANISNIASEVQ